MKIPDLDTLRDVREVGHNKRFPDHPRIGVGMGTCGTGNGADQVYAAIEEAIKRHRLDATLVPVGCFGFCAAEPLVNVQLPLSPS